MGKIRQNLPPDAREYNELLEPKLGALRGSSISTERCSTNLPMPKQIRLATTEWVSESVLLTQYPSLPSTGPNEHEDPLLPSQTHWQDVTDLGAYIVALGFLTVPEAIISIPAFLRVSTIMSIESQKRKVLITGCSPGSIGEALAQEFLNRDGRHALYLVSRLSG